MTHDKPNTLGHPCSRLAPSISTASSSTKGSGRQSRRGTALLEFHGGTYIPPSDSTHEPVLPQREPDDSDLHRFTDEEKIFFIRYLRWRLREDRVPSKDTLFKELAKEVSSTGRRQLRSSVSILGTAEHTLIVTYNHRSSRITTLKRGRNTGETTASSRTRSTSLHSSGLKTRRASFPIARATRT